MWLHAAILALVTAERLAELAFSRQNTQRLLAAGGREAGRAHYPAIAGLHALWLAGLWLLVWRQPVNFLFLGIFLLLQLFRLWVLLTLGRRWTTRIVVVPGAELVTAGPYRWLRHPNYAVVAAEIVCLPLVFGLVWYAALFSVLNAAILRVRIRAEDAALSDARGRSG